MDLVNLAGSAATTGAKAIAAHITQHPANCRNILMADPVGLSWQGVASPFWRSQSEIVSHDNQLSLLADGLVATNPAEQMALCHSG